MINIEIKNIQLQFITDDTLFSPKKIDIGTLSMLEVNDAEVTYLNAQLAYLQAIYEYFSSTLQVLKLLGA